MKTLMNPDRISSYLNKPREDFTRKDLIRFIEKSDIEMVNFRYVGGDGKLKTLNFFIRRKSQLDRLLAAGERVDGSSIFPYIDASSSDLYVIPRYRTAYVNPFSVIPAVDMLCSYYTSDGVPLPSAPENIVRKAHQTLKKNTGLTFEAMGELEYYVLANKQYLYPNKAQKGYQTSAPFSKWENIRIEAMRLIAQTGGKIKYSHSEVGNITDVKEDMEQHEIELFPVPLEDAADQITIAKWILRMLGHKYGVTITFVPKIMLGHAGSGLHIHTRFTKNNKNVMVKSDRLSDEAKKIIAGYLSLAQSLTAFGNTVPVSYLRLVPHQEAPTNICWGDRNRSVLVRVPLGWLNTENMAKDANPREKGEMKDLMKHQTVEFRGSDGSANIYLLLAGLAVAARYGWEMKNGLALADKLYVDVNIFSDRNKKLQKNLPQLPASCWESADHLLKDRRIYERDGVFSLIAIDGLVKQLKSYNDRNLNEKLFGRKEKIKKLVAEYIHCA
ncbi:MAG: glutamine synthetase family protein [Planctomycetota bacterium]|nr:glutamine synthetase family protein [Planctomycetota bacterium]MDI6788631.1 glutamine synthetase family protein [Planctomycetota bacterium]